MDSIGCCSSDTVNFSLLRMAELPLDFTHTGFWLTLCLMFLKPFYKAVVGVWEHRSGVLRKYLGQSTAFTFYTLVSHMLGLFTFVCFHYSLRHQPHTYELHRNGVLVSGYTLLLLGVTFKAWAYIAAGGAHMLGGSYFGLGCSPPRSERDLYYQPSGAGSVLMYAGCALLRARSAGILLTAVLAVAYLLAFSFERAQLRSTWPVKLSKPELKSTWTTLLPDSTPHNRLAQIFKHRHETVKNKSV